MNDMTKILVTGAAGHLGSHLVSELADAGFDVTALDIVQPDPHLGGEADFVQADLRRPDSFRPVLEGQDILVHCASIHPWKDYSEDQYHDANIKGTWHLYAAAEEAGLDRVVLTSSIAAVGYGPGSGTIPVVTEDSMFSLQDLYSLTKHVQEDIAGMYADRGRIRTIALRPPAFMPRSDLATGFALTGHFAGVEDMVSAHLAAVEVLAGRRKTPRPLDAFEPFFTTNALPYTAEDLSGLGPEGDIRPLVQKYWPEAYDWLVERGYEGGWLPAVYDLSKAKRLLGWKPRFNFDQWWAERRGNSKEE
jgi:nucleoside-diphosphate-sugar epimerase